MKTGEDFMVVPSWTFFCLFSHIPVLYNLLGPDRVHPAYLHPPHSFFPTHHTLHNKFPRFAQCAFWVIEAFDYIGWLINR